MKKFLKKFLLFLKLNRLSIFISLILTILWKTKIIKCHWIWVLCPFWLPFIITVFVIIIGYITIIFTGLSTSNIKTTFLLVQNFHKEIIQILIQRLKEIKESWM